MMDQYVTKNQKKLRCGITTGSCAAAAAEAAAAHFLLGVKKDRVLVKTPSGVVLNVAVSEEENSKLSGVTYSVIKDSGDDPDVTSGCRVCANIYYLEESRNKADMFHDSRYQNLYLDGGEGVGRVTKEGLEQRVGQAAINSVPRQMIFQTVDRIACMAENNRPLIITISIPEGKSLAERTFNPRLGIEGGLSVLGTSGILEPMSERAIVDTIEAEIRQRHIQGEHRLLVTPGNYGREYARSFLKLDIDEGVKCSNYVGEMLDFAVTYEMTEVLLVGNIGKLVKLAAGIMNTHSRIADGRMEILTVHTVLCGGDRKLAERIMDCINTDEALGVLYENGVIEKVINSLCVYIDKHIKHRVGSSLQCGVMLFSEKYGYLGCTDICRQILKDFGVSREV